MPSPFKLTHTAGYTFKMWIMWRKNLSENFTTLEVFLRYDCKYIWRGRQILIEKLYGKDSFNNNAIEDRAYLGMADDIWHISRAVRWYLASYLGLSDLILYLSCQITFDLEIIGKNR